MVLVMLHWSYIQNFLRIDYDFFCMRALGMMIIFCFDE